MAYSGKWFSGPSNHRSYADDLCFTENEIRNAKREFNNRWRSLEYEFEYQTGLNGLDISILLFGAVLQTLRWALIPNTAFRFDSAAASDKFFKNAADNYCPASISSLLSNARVPYDVVVRGDNFKDYSTGLSGANHRYMALGHDPLLGLIVGTANIATNTVTVNDFGSGYPSYCVMNNKIVGQTDLSTIMSYTADLLVYKPKVVGVAFLKQIAHSGTDIFTRQGLPIPFINTVSPQAAGTLINKAHIDMYSVTRGIALTLVIDKIVGMIHKLYFNPRVDNLSLYNYKTYKVIKYSNILASTINLLYVGLTHNWTRIDIGGILVTLYKLLYNSVEKQELKYAFIKDVLDNKYKEAEASIDRELASFGICY